ncbi:MAG: MATE family efflux transporter, partial [Clostridiales bacterium]|nr:MATE family efflux transporter [Clostridiales bacterium]
LVMGVPGALIRIFTDDSAIIESGMRSVRIYFSMGMFMSLQLSSQFVFISLGKSKFAITFSMLRKALLSAPLTVILPIFIGTDGVFLADAIAQVISGTTCFLVMYFTQYRKLGRETERLPA